MLPPTGAKKTSGLPAFGGTPAEIDTSLIPVSRAGAGPSGGYRSESLTGAALLARFANAIATVFVDLTSNQTIIGQKTFYTNPIVPAPGDDNHAVNRLYVTDLVEALPAYATAAALTTGLAGKLDATYFSGAVALVQTGAGSYVRCADVNELIAILGTGAARRVELLQNITLAGGTAPGGANPVLAFDSLIVSGNGYTLTAPTDTAVTFNASTGPLVLEHLNLVLGSGTITFTGAGVFTATGGRWDGVKLDNVVLHLTDTVLVSLDDSTASTVYLSGAARNDSGQGRADFVVVDNSVTCGQQDTVVDVDLAGGGAADLSAFPLARRIRLTNQGLGVKVATLVGSTAPVLTVFGNTSGDLTLDGGFGSTPMAFLSGASDCTLFGNGHDYIVFEATSGTYRELRRAIS